MTKALLAFDAYLDNPVCGVLIGELRWCSLKSFDRTWGQVSLCRPGEWPSLSGIDSAMNGTSIEQATAPSSVAAATK